MLVQKCLGKECTNSLRVVEINQVLLMLCRRGKILICLMNTCIIPRQSAVRQAIGPVNPSWSKTPCERLRQTAEDDAERENAAADTA